MTRQVLCPICIEQRDACGAEGIVLREMAFEKGHRARRRLYCGQAKNRHNMWRRINTNRFMSFHDTHPGQGKSGCEQTELVSFSSEAFWNRAPVRHHFVCTVVVLAVKWLRRNRLIVIRKYKLCAPRMIRIEPYAIFPFVKTADHPDRTGCYFADF